MKKEAKILLQKSTDSLVLAVDKFNTPWPLGREEAVLILLDRAFELVLKASIVEKGGRIREPRQKETIGFDKCVRKCLSEEKVKCLNEDEALTIQVINSLRDAAQHYILDISEELLYLFTQAGVTLSGALIKRVFGHSLSDYLPQRVLPVAVTPPISFDRLVDKEYKQIRQLVRPGLRKRLEARAKLRALAVIKDSLAGIRSQPSPRDLDRTLSQIADGKSWPTLFPGVRTLQLDTEGSGLTISIRLTKREGEPVTMVREGTPGATVIAIKRVNELGYYSLKLDDLKDKIGLTRPKTLALIRHLGIQESEDYFKEIRLGSALFKRYSLKALDRLKKALPDVDMSEVWEQHRPGKK